MVLGWCSNSCKQRSLEHKIRAFSKCLVAANEKWFKTCIIFYHYYCWDSGKAQDFKLAQPSKLGEHLNLPALLLNPPEQPKHHRGNFWTCGWVSLNRDSSVKGWWAPRIKANSKREQIHPLHGGEELVLGCDSSGFSFSLPRKKMNNMSGWIIHVGITNQM